MTYALSNRQAFALMGALIAEGLIEQMIFLGPVLLGQFCSAELVVMGPLVLGIDILLSLVPSALLAIVLIRVAATWLNGWSMLTLLVFVVTGHHLLSRMGLMTFAFKDCGATTWTLWESFGMVVLSPALWLGLVTQWVLAALIMGHDKKRKVG